LTSFEAVEAGGCATGSEATAAARLPSTDHAIPSRGPSARGACACSSVASGIAACHMHRYHGATKVAPETFDPGAGVAINEQLPIAIRHMIEHHRAIYEAWHRRS